MPRQGNVEITQESLTDMLQELKHLRRQRDELQASNTAYRERYMKAEAALASVNTTLR